MKNQIHLSITIIIFMLVFAWFTFFKTSTEEGIQKQPIVFPTSTSTASIGGNEWWKAMPAPLIIETMQP